MLTAAGLWGRNSGHILSNQQKRKLISKNMKKGQKQENESEQVDNEERPWVVVRKVNTLFGRHKAIHCQCDPSHNYNNRIDKTTRNTITITTHRPGHSEQTLPIRIFVVPVFDRVSAACSRSPQISKAR